VTFSFNCRGISVGDFKTNEVHWTSVCRKKFKQEGMSGAVPVTWRSLISPTGEFVRKESTFRDRISKDGKFPPAAGRYHLYVANACPWAHRTRVVRSLKGLEDVISISFVGPFLGENGWAFDEQHKDSVHGFKQLREVYSLAAGKDWTDRVTVPVLFDKGLNSYPIFECRL
jgi:putative glutathione S-transferase